MASVKAHSGGEAPRHCPTLSAAYRAEAERVCLRSPMLAVVQVMVTPTLAQIGSCSMMTITFLSERIYQFTDGLRASATDLIDRLGKSFIAKMKLDANKQMAFGTISGHSPRSSP